jgi:hypothetical protein
MINGAHVVVYSKNAGADRAFFRDVLKFPFVDAGHEWLIFALLAAESAFHPAQANNKHEFYLICDNVNREMTDLRAKGVECADVVETRWGSITKIPQPGGGKIGLYQRSIRVQGSDVAVSGGQ